MVIRYCNPKSYFNDTDGTDVCPASCTSVNCITAVKCLVRVAFMIGLILRHI